MKMVTIVSVAILGLALIQVIESHYTVVRPLYPFTNPWTRLGWPSPLLVPTCTCGQLNRPKVFPAVIGGTSSGVNEIPKVLPAVVGGTSAEVNEIPWRCYLEHDKIGLCGATIISSEWIMTAAHCFDNFEGEEKENLKNGGKVIVTCGDHDRSTINETKHVSINAQQILVHEEYNKDVKFNNDIALIRLAQGLTWKENISPVCLPFRGEGWDCGLTNTSVLASGWGDTTGDGGTSNVLQKGSLSCLSRKECGDLYEKEDVKLTDNMICTYIQGKDTCQGDSGGSIDYEYIDGLHYSIGIVSFGKGCAEEGRPGVYSRVTAYLNWIREKTENAFFCGL